MARSFEERQITEDIIDKEHRDVVCIRWANSSPCRIGLLLETACSRGGHYEARIINSLCRALISENLTIRLTGTNVPRMPSWIDSWSPDNPVPNPPSPHPRESALPGQARDRRLS